MSFPKAYHTNLFSQGTLSGSQSTAANPVRRVGDGSLNLSYTATAGSPPSGAYQVTLDIAAAPDAFALARGLQLSGYRLIVESEDVGGGNNATILDFTVSGTEELFVREINPMPTARRVWRVTLSGVSGLSPALLHETLLASSYALPRSPQVGVPRTRRRQFTRIDIPGGQPFVKRDGPVLRGNQYTVTLLSGAQVSGAEAFVDAVEGGQAFYFVDDRAEEYYAELIGQDQIFQDDAGVEVWAFTVQEVKAE